MNPNNFLILVVDDTKENLQLIGSILEQQGYDTTFAINGKQALERIEIAKPDLILLDLMMPGMDGLEVCNQLKSNPDYASIPIIFITANPEKEYLVKAFQQGAVDYITKPFYQEEVLVRIQNQLRLRLQEQQLQQLAQQQQEKATQLEATLQELKQTQTQLIQAKNMSTLSQTVAGIAHEINNPISFIDGNLKYAREYFQNLLSLIQLYQQIYPDPHPEIVKLQEEVELDFIVQDWQHLMKSMQIGSERISELILSLRRFSRLDESEIKSTDINEDIDNALMILRHRFKAIDHRPDIQIIKDYSQLPKITCYAGQINQVLMNLLNNAIEALDAKAHRQQKTVSDSPTITISTKLITRTEGSLPTSNFVFIQITDNGCGMDKEVKKQIFEPFFTTKSVGTGMGVGLAISYQIIVENHQGHLHCISVPGKGTQMMIEIPVELCLLRK